MKGGKWFSLMDKVYAPANLQAAWEKVRTRKGAGVDGQTARDFEARKERELARLSEELRKQIGRPFWIDTVGKSALVEIRVQLDNAMDMLSIGYVVNAAMAFLSERALPGGKAPLETTQVARNHRATEISGTEPLSLFSAGTEVVANDR